MARTQRQCYSEPRQLLASDWFSGILLEHQRQEPPSRLGWQLGGGSRGQDGSMGVGRCLGLLPIIAHLRLQPGERLQWIGGTHTIASPKPNTSGGRSTDAFISYKVLDSSFVAVQSVNINIVVLCQTINLNIIYGVYGYKAAIKSRGKEFINCCPIA